MIFGAQGQKILIFGAPGIENTIDFWCSGIRILIFGAPEAPTKGGDPSTCQKPPESFEKTMVLGGWADGRVGCARNPGPPKSTKI